MVTLENIGLKNMIETVSVIYLHYIEGYLKELDLDSEAIFRDAGLIYPENIQSGNSVGLQVIAKLIEQVNVHVKRPDFAFQLGRRIPLMAHGNLGAAMLACRDLHALLVLSERFSRLAFPSISLSVCEQGDNTAFKITTNTGFPTLNVAIVDAILGTCMENLQRLSDTTIQPISINLRHKKPQYFGFYNTLLDNSIEFDSLDNTLIFSKKTMATQLKTADNIGQNILIEKCKNDLEDIEQNSPLITRTTEIIITHLSTPPTLSFVANALEISERTLRRRLAEKNIGFRDLVRKIRHEKAIYLLQNTQLRIDVIANKLGYRETSNFRRAFKKTTGKSPRDWRKTKKTAHPCADKI